MFKPRPTQIPILAYTGGKMGISAVPGSGKTTTLSNLAAKLIMGDFLQEEQEVLIVTMSNSAVDNFNHQIEKILTEAGYIPGMGYRVRTLHSLANDIIRRKPEQVGLDNAFQIADNYMQTSLQRDAILKWMRLHPDVIQNWSSDDSLPWNKYQSKWEKLLSDTATAFIGQAKNYGHEPEKINALLEQHPEKSPLLYFGAEIYQDYQQGLRYRGAVDFDDLIRLAYKVLILDSDYLNELQNRWPFILEDEAQDSSLKQEEILRLLSQKNGNWVRVGDPNQAIYVTFTTASPEHLIRFIQSPDVTSHHLPESGRSAQSIIQLANALIDWTNTGHPYPEVRKALRLPYLQPTQPDDPNPNPPDQPESIRLYMKKMSSDEELNQVARSLKHWLPEHPEETVAVLSATNTHAEKLVEILDTNRIPYVELLKSNLDTRSRLQLFIKILQHIHAPTQLSTLADIYTALHIHPSPDDLQRIVKNLLLTCQDVVQYIWPTHAQTWTDVFPSLSEGSEIINELDHFRILLQKWHKASLYPIDQFILITAADIFTDLQDLSLSYAIAQSLERVARENPQASMHTFIHHLQTLSKTGGDLKDTSEENTGFIPELHKGKVVVSTFHKAKGLEWDRVYLLSVNNYDFPSGDDADSYVSEKEFVQNQENLSASILYELEKLVNPSQLNIESHLTAKQQARYDLAAERLRVLFVGITRAKKELIITWNTGRMNQCQPALALQALDQYWQQREPL